MQISKYTDKFCPYYHRMSIKCYIHLVYLTTFLDVNKFTKPLLIITYKLTSHEKVACSLCFSHFVLKNTAINASSFHLSLSEVNNLSFVSVELQKKKKKEREGKEIVDEKRLSQISRDETRVDFSLQKPRQIMDKLFTAVPQ